MLEMQVITSHMLDGHSTYAKLQLALFLNKATVTRPVVIWCGLDISFGRMGGYNSLCLPDGIFQGELVNSYKPQYRRTSQKSSVSDGVSRTWGF